MRNDIDGGDSRGGCLQHEQGNAEGRKCATMDTNTYHYNMQQKLERNHHFWLINCYFSNGLKCISIPEN